MNIVRILYEYYENLMEYKCVEHWVFYVLVIRMLD